MYHLMSHLDHVFRRRMQRSRIVHHFQPQAAILSTSLRPTSILVLPPSWQLGIRAEYVARQSEMGVWPPWTQRHLCSRAVRSDSRCGTSSMQQPRFTSISSALGRARQRASFSFWYPCGQRLEIYKIGDISPVGCADSDT